MKKIFILFLTIFLLFSCNLENQTETIENEIKKESVKIAQELKPKEEKKETPLITIWFNRKME